jgi:hypothetical protein
LLSPRPPYEQHGPEQNNSALSTLQEADLLAQDGSDPRIFRCLDCDSLDPLKADSVKGWLEASWGATSSVSRPRTERLTQERLQVSRVLTDGSVSSLRHVGRCVRTGS